MKRITAGILAHVDAGKTTCTESMLFNAGRIRRMGRVDHRDTVLDYDQQERNHGITIYSKETWFSWNGSEVYVLDTPGHVDFSSEMERTLSLLDIAVILINGQDGVQAHTRTIWKCLEHYHIPAVIFVNKMDISYLSKQQLLEDLQKQCSENCIDFEDDDRDEHLAMVSDEMLNAWSENGTIPDEMISEAVMRRRCFPVLFGSALKNEGITRLMDAVVSLVPEKSYPSEFGARIFRIFQDEKKDRLVHVKITGGSLKAKEKIGEDQKVDQIRRYSGNTYEVLEEADAGMVVALKGLEGYTAGQGLGFEKDVQEPVLSAYMTYELLAPEDADQLALERACRLLEEEDPTLEISVNETTHKIHLQIMGSMQMEVLQKKIYDRTGIHVGFGDGDIVYHETIANPVEGAGHFEPLRHYAEVHVRLEPAERDSGIHVSSECSTDELSSVWQKSILSSLMHKRHKGVLTGSLLSDVNIVLTAGKASAKHTSGGDFRQAACRAVRQALEKAENILLEPYYSFTLTLTPDVLSRALYDLDSRHAEVSVSENENGTMTISGKGPVRLLMNYQNEVTAYTKGRGHFECQPSGYESSPDQDEIIASIGYDSEMDLHNPSGSVFCSHGSGYFVPWNEADEKMDIQLKDGNRVSSSASYQRAYIDEEEVKRVFDMTSGKNRNEAKRAGENRKKKEEEKKQKRAVSAPALPRLLIVDGYNMVFGWDETKLLAASDLSSAREKVIDMIYNYQPFLGCRVIIVFDGYKMKDNIGTTYTKGDVTVIYTRTDETADAWIEKAGYDFKGKYQLIVATSDGLIQNAVFSQGALRMTARELEENIRLYQHSYEVK